MILLHTIPLPAEVSDSMKIPSSAPTAAFNAFGLQFVTRLYHLRLCGLGVGFFCVATVFFANGAASWLWGLLIAHAFVWPHVAYSIALRAKSPRHAELRNLLIDSAMGGVWVAAMQFNLLPSALLVVMLAIDKLSVGGPRLVGRALICQAAACFLATSWLGFAWRPETSMLEIYGALPLLAIYPLAISGATYQLARTVSRQNQRLAQLTRIDRLTGLLNRGTWEDTAMDVLRRHQRIGAPAALLMIDIDHFKEINDRHGHPTGDQVIRSVAAIIQRCIRDVDVSGRYGGDEFGIVLVQTDIEAALRVAEHIRLNVLAGDPDGMPVAMSTVSIGIATNSSAMHDMRAWVKRADVALFEAKARGRDCVVVAA
jgi:diguanylate cyclase